jgi:hypothetical protein
MAEFRPIQTPGGSRQLAAPVLHDAGGFVRRPRPAACRASASTASSRTPSRSARRRSASAWLWAQPWGARAAQRSRQRTLRLAVIGIAAAPSLRLLVSRAIAALLFNTAAQRPDHLCRHGAAHRRRCSCWQATFPRVEPRASTPWSPCATTSPATTWVAALPGFKCETWGTQLGDPQDSRPGQAAEKLNRRGWKCQGTTSVVPQIAQNQSGL